MNDEILTRNNPDRHTLFPIQYPDMYEMYKKALASFWTVEEVDLSRDRDDWAKLTENERHFIKNVLAFFAASDGIVLENLSTQILPKIQISEANLFYATQAQQEAIHSEQYSLLIDTLINDPTEKELAFRAIHHVPSIQKKAAWALRWIEDPEVTVAQRILAFACVEGIFFSGSFCAIYWLKKRGIMPGLTLSNEFIARDEGMHTDFACLLYSKYVQNRLSQEKAHAMVREALDVEKEFILESLPCALIGMNAESMSQYLEYVADRLLVMLGYDKVFQTSNPFEWMNMLGLQGKTNFFEDRVSSYTKSNVLSTVEDRKVAFDDDF